MPIFLSKIERFYLYKSIIRLHKEKGSFSYFISKNPNFCRTKFLSKNLFIDTYSLSHALLNKYLWGVFKDFYNEINKTAFDEIVFLQSSIDSIELVDYLKNCKYPVLQKLCTEIVTHELNFIDGLKNNSFSTREKQAIEKAFDKYSIYFLRTE